MTVRDHATGAVADMAPGQAAEARNSMLLTVLDGLVPIAQVAVSMWSPCRREREAQAYADIISVASELFNGATPPTAHEMKALPPPHLSALDQKSRNYQGREILGALARALALGAAVPGGVSFAGRHWCERPHEGCPSGNLPQEAP